MIHSVQIGPVSLPPGLVLAALVLTIALLVGNWLGRKAGVEVESRIYRGLFISAICARLGFVLQYHEAYSSTPWSVLDFRDGGWSPWAGLLAAWLYAATVVLRFPTIRKPLLSGLTAASAIWIVGTVVLALPSRERQFLPDFNTLSINGDHIALQSYVGRPAVVNLWATWCPPCRREMPVFERAQNEHLDINIVFLNQGEAPAKIQQFLAGSKLSLRNVLIDTQGEVARSMGQKGLPTTLFFNAAGRLVDVRVGEFSYPTLNQRIDALRLGHEAGGKT